VGTPSENTDMMMPAAPAPTGGEAARNARYVYLVGRLRNRQMTMEEATELFGLMQGMLRTSEIARQAAIRAIASRGAAPSAPPAAKPPTGAPPAGGTLSADELLMLGLLGTGAASGVLAALTKRVQELMASAPSPQGAKSDAPSS
jgi:hypothetical protein